MSPPNPSATPQVAVVVIAHGSRTDGANVAHQELATGLQTRVGHPVIAAFLELATPSIVDGIDQAVATGAQVVVVVPYFLHPGRHQSEDVPRLVDEARRTRPDVDVRLLDLFGADPELLDVLASQVDRARRVEES